MPKIHYARCPVTSGSCQLVTDLLRTWYDGTRWLHTGRTVKYPNTSPVEPQAHDVLFGRSWYDSPVVRFFIRRLTNGRTDGADQEGRAATTVDWSVERQLRQGRHCTITERRTGIPG